MKKIYSLLLAVTLLISPIGSYAESTTNTSVKLTMDKAIETGIQNSKDLLLLDKKISIAESDVRLANANVDFYKNKYYETAAERQSNAKKAYLLPVQKVNALEKLKRDKTEKLKSLKIEIIQKYNTLLKSEMALVNLNQSVVSVKKELDNKKVEYKLGKVTQLDVDKIEVKYEQAVLDVAKAEDSNQSLNMELNNVLGLPLMTNVEVVMSDIKVVDFKVTSPSEVFKTYMTDQASIKSIETNINELELEIKVIKENSGTSLAYDNSANTEVDDLQTSLDQAKVDLVNKKITLEYDFNKQMRNLSNQLEDINIAKINLDIAQKDEQVSKAKYALGKTDALTFLQMGNATTNAKEAYTNAIIAYNQSVEEFKIEYGL